MSLLDRCEGFEPVTVYPQESYQDADGNTMLRTSATPIPGDTEARWQIQGQSGTSSRKAEQQEEGYESERVYTIRFSRQFDRDYGPLGLASKIVRASDGYSYSIFGKPEDYRSSRRTAHTVYTVRRA